MIKSGVITVTTAGTAEAGPDVIYSHRLVLMAHPANTSPVAFGNDDGDITMATGFVMDGGAMGQGQVVIEGSGNLKNIVFDVTASGEQFTYLAY